MTIDEAHERDADEWAVDADLGEALHDSEKELASRIAETIAEGVRQQHRDSGPIARRDAHPKAHGCVTALFRVEENLPPALARGVFQPGATYRAWVRFSNGDANVQRPDAKGDVRAMALKLFDVPGKKILPEDTDAVTQDFIMINSPVFVTDHPDRYLKVIERNASTNPLVKLSAGLALGLKGASIALGIQASHIASPFTTRYWSTVPYRLGVGPDRQAIKFSVIPHTTHEVSVDKSDPNYLRHAMVEQLSKSEAVFDFLVQPRASSAMSVEDSQTEWSEDEAPFVKVATITIPKQVFATPERDALAERLSFNPWHSLPEHRPLGGVNRIRRVVYKTISNLRRQLNGVTIEEPRAWVDA